ncbi:MAG: glycosyltransferase [Fluviicola sp.]
MYFSLIIPVYNRPDEINELLDSLTKQSYKEPFEVVIVEDGSKVDCKSIVENYSQLAISYFFKENSGPGDSRNYGMQRAKGDYFIILDSDCIIPEDYLKNVSQELNDNFVDCFGGPDAAHASFTVLQKAINYSMSSFLTTGGIRGGSKSVDKFHPRSFNMGYSKTVFETTKGFAKMRFGEDIDMSLRIIEGGFKTRLIRSGFVFHKRRSTFKQFYKQVFNSGIARINLYKRHPKSLKLVHFAPALFTVFSILFVLLSFFNPLFILPNCLHVLLIFIHSSIENKSIQIGFYSIGTSYTQLFGYGFGFIKSIWRRLILKQDEFQAFEKTFYK